MFRSNGVTIRLAARDVDPLEVVFFRKCLQPPIYDAVVYKNRVAGLRTDRFGLHCFRTASSLTSMFLWFTALTLLPLAEATSLSFTAPLFATVGAAIFLVEDVRFRRWFAVVLGFVGTLIILRPGFEVVTPGALLMLAGSVFVATSILLVKVLSRTESPNTMVLMVALIATPISAIPLFWVWEMPQGITWVWLACVGAAATGGHLCFNRAMVSADASAVLLMSTRLIFVALMGFLLFSEVPGCLDLGWQSRDFWRRYIHRQPGNCRAIWEKNAQHSRGNSARRLRREDFGTSPRFPVRDDPAIGPSDITVEAWVFWAVAQVIALCFKLDQRRTSVSAVLLKHGRVRRGRISARAVVAAPC